MLMPKYDLFELVTHLKKCPEIFLKPSNLLARDGLDSIALISDTYRMVSAIFLKKELNVPAKINFNSIDDNYWKAIHISCWLLYHHSFRNKPALENKLRLFWFEELYHVTQYVKYKEWITDEERAEEMVRLLLLCFEILPNGESIAEAADKLSSISSVDRQKVLRQSYEAHERIMNIKREMAEKKAREAANTYGRE